MNRGEVWLADLGYVGKIRPVLILSIIPGPDDRALISYIIRTTSLRGTAYEIIHSAKGMKVVYSIAKESEQRTEATSCVNLGELKTPCFQK